MSFETFLEEFNLSSLEYFDFENSQNYNNNDAFGNFGVSKKLLLVQKSGNLI